VLLPRRGSIHEFDEIDSREWQDDRPTEHQATGHELAGLRRMDGSGGVSPIFLLGEFEP
jgi:hypothetical protein